MNTPQLWTARVEDYLAYRRNAGFNVVGDSSRLQQFRRFADQQIPPQSHLVVELAVAWARSTKHQHPFTWARRLELLRGFARYWQRFDPMTEMPPRGLLGKAYRRLTPHIFTQQEVSTLMAAAAGLQPRDGLRPATCATMIGLLEASGLRPIEAIRLTRNDVDLDQGDCCLSRRRRGIEAAGFHCIRAQQRRYAPMLDYVIAWCASHPASGSFCSIMVSLPTYEASSVPWKHYAVDLDGCHVAIMRIIAVMTSDIALSSTACCASTAKGPMLIMRSLRSRLISATPQLPTLTGTAPRRQN